jgi:hypothetical protein
MKAADMPRTPVESAKTLDARQFAGALGDVNQ